MPRTSSVRPVEALADVLRVFFRSSTVRGLAVPADNRLRAAALQTVRGFEFHADNRSPLLVVELSGQGDDDSDWQRAVDALREEHEACRSSGAPLDSLTPRPMGNHGSANFSAQLLQCGHSVNEPAEGLLVVIVAKGAADAAWLARLADMAGSEELQALRWIIIAGLECKVGPWVSRFPPGVAIEHRMTMDEAVAVAELSSELDRLEERGDGQRGAGPRGVHPPPRPRAWRPPTRRPTRPPEAQSEPETAGRDPTRPPDTSAQSDSQGDADASPPPPEILVQRAALAMRSGDGATAVVHQAAARDAYAAAGADRDAVSMELMLGAYLVELQQPRLGAEAFGRAGTAALEIDAGDLAAEAYVAQGSALHQDNALVAALQAYRHAIETAQSAERPSLALQAYWLAGQLALSMELDLDCVGLWADAVVYANKLEPEGRAGSKAKPIAEMLGTLLIRHRRFSEAREIERLAAGF